MNSIEEATVAAWRAQAERVTIECVRYVDNHSVFTISGAHRAGKHTFEVQITSPQNTTTSDKEKQAFTELHRQLSSIVSDLDAKIKMHV